MLLRTIACLTTGLLAASTAGAATIDFRDSAFAGVGASNPYAVEYGGVGMTLSAVDPHFATELVWTGGRGIGVDRVRIVSFDEYDVIDDLERFRITLDEVAPVTSLSVSSLYREGWQDGRHEAGWYDLHDGTGRHWFSAREGDGDLTIDLGAGIETARIEFGARIFGSHDFAVAGFTTGLLEGGDGRIDPQPGGATPEPTAALLFGVGAAVVAAAARRSR